MKKILILILMLFGIIGAQLLIGCNSNKSVQFKEFYSQVIGFSEKNEKSKPIPKDAILMMNKEDFLKFKNQYFTPRAIPMETPDSEKAVLFLQIPSATSSVNQYTVKSIDVTNNTLTVSLKQSGVLEVDGVSGFNGTWKWVMLLEVDKMNLKENMKVVVKK